MLNINPEKASSTQSWNSDSKEDRLGFIFRDSSTTNALSTPMVMPRLGMNVPKFMSEKDRPGTATALGLGMQWANPQKLNAGSLTHSIPGILTYDFVPLYAQSVSAEQGGHLIEAGEVPDIFINTWTRLRRLNNMTEKFMPSDIQWMYNGYMEILMHVENIRRILKVIQRVVQSSKSDYVRETAILSALGFPLDPSAARMNWTNWRNSFNVSILGKLRSIPWFLDLVPGAKRWAGLCKEIYKDDPNRTDYTQLYLMKPRFVWYLRESQIASDPAPLYGWNVVRRNYQVGDSDVPTNPIAALTNYINMIIELISDVFYSDSASIVQATINAIDARNWKEDQKMTFAPIDLEDLPFDLGNGDYPFTYDFNVMLSLHNATIFDDRDANFYIEPPQIGWTYDSTTSKWTTDGVLHQKIWIYNTTLAKQNKANTVKTDEDAKSSDVKIQQYNGYNAKIVDFAKVLNLPWFNASMEDVINATQWTVISNSMQLTEETIPLEPEACGTEIIVREQCYYYSLSSGSTASVYSIQNSSNRHLIDRDDSDDLINGIVTISRLNSFALYPIVYFARNVYEGQTLVKRIESIINQEDVLYAVSREVLQPIHAQFLRNFWGYPFVVGAPDSSNKTDKSTHE